MDKKRIREIIIFAVIFIVYNVLAFVIPFKKNAVFAVAYIFALISVIAFAANYIFAFEKAKTLKSKFLSYPIFRIGLLYLISQLILSTLLMVLTSFINIYVWIAIVPCILILAIAIIKTFTLDMAREKIENIAIKEEINTSFIGSLQIDIKTLSNRASNENIKTKLLKLSEAVKYSDPVSNEVLAEIESNIKIAFDELKTNINAGSNDVEPLVNELNNLLSERNDKCKIYKNKYINGFS